MLPESAPRETVITPPSLSRLNLFKSISKLVRYRDLFYTLSAHRISVRYKQTLLGVSWALLQPVSMMLIFTLIFSFIAKMPSEGVPYAVFVFPALLARGFFSNRWHEKFSQLAPRNMQLILACHTETAANAGRRPT